MLKSICLPHRVSLDPESQKTVGLLRGHLSQFSRQYKAGSLADPQGPSILKSDLES